MWNWIKNLFSDKEEKKSTEELRLLSSEIESSDDNLRFRFQIINGRKCNLQISSKSDYLYFDVHGETDVEGRCYLKIGEDENFKIMTGIFSCSYPYVILTIEDVALSDFRKNDFTKCRVMSKTRYIDTKLDENFNRKVRCAINDLLERNEILTTNPTKDL